MFVILAALLVLVGPFTSKWFRRPSLSDSAGSTATATQEDGPVGDTEAGLCPSSCYSIHFLNPTDSNTASSGSIDPYHEMSKSFDDSIIHKGNTFEGPALPEQTYANLPPSYSDLSVCHGAEVKVPGYHELGIELSPISPPPSVAHCD